MHFRQALVCVSMLLSGCASPSPRYFALEPVVGSVRHSPGRAVVVRSAIVPHYLERDEIVREAGHGRVRVSGNDWWSEPLRQMLQRVLAADLSQRLPRWQVVGTESLGGERTRIILAVSRFEPDGAGSLVLDGYLKVEAGSHEQILRRVSEHTQLTGHRMEDQVAAMSQALAVVADTASSMLEESVAEGN